MSIVNLFSNFDDLTKINLLNNSASNYNKEKIKLNTPTPGLSQGRNFKKYQSKITSLVNNKEGFNNLNNDFDTDVFNLDPNGLTNQSKQIINNSDYSSQQQIINNLRQEYDNTLLELENLQNQISGTSTNYINRISKNNPYAGKNVRFSDGAICYVTHQGVVKWYSNPDILDATAGKNGCPPQNWIQLEIDFLPYITPGTTIPTNPPLISGTQMVQGQSCGKEGSNVYVDKLVYKPTTSNIGCYNNVPPSTDILFVPIMNESNNVNGFQSFASSVYQNNNSFAGPWAAFDRNLNDFWHQMVSSTNDYDPTSGEYLGTTQVSVNTSSGVQIIKGEFLQISLPNVNTSSAVSYPLTKYELQGRQGCCGNTNGPNGRSPNSWYILGYNNSDQQWYQVDMQENQALSYELRTYTVSDSTPYSAYIIIITNCGNPGDTSGNRYCVQISQWNLYTSSNLVNAPTPSMTNIGQMSYKDCSLYALNSGNKYFGLSQTDSSGNHTCFVSNDLAGSEQYGVGNNYNPKPLWSSQTNSTSGVTAILNNSGSLSVLNSSGASIFSTPNSSGDSSYIGCYGDTSNRAMPNTSNNQYLPLDQCKQFAIDNNLNYYGSQDAHGGDNGWCVGSNDLSSAKQYGVANSCTKDSNGNFVGSAWSNAIYSVNPNVECFLILQDDGNMCIYKGSGPSDNQGIIWATGTNGKQNDPNPNFTSAKSQYNRNYILTNETLMTNQFVGSTDGSIYLIMQSDGNLVLYTNTISSMCSASSSNKYNIGQQNANALYQLNEMGNIGNLGKLAFVDQDAQLHDYPSTNIKYNNTYTVFDGNSANNDIANAAYSGATIDQCKSTCNANDDCAGFVFDNTNSVCYPKTSGMYPTSTLTTDSNMNAYVRGKMPITLPVGVSNKIDNTDTIMYQSYVNGGDLSENYGLSEITSVQQQQLEQLQTKLNLLSNQITNFTNKFGTGSQNAEQQSLKNVAGLKGYLNDLTQNTNKINNFNNSIDNIVNDSDIVVLQKNYDYLFWSILAAGTVLISMNIIKK
jgi:hypothetical protein